MITKDKKERKLEPGEVAILKTIKEIRTEKKMGMRKMAAAIGTSYTHYSRTESGFNSMSLGKFVKIINALGFTIKLVHTEEKEIKTGK